jgi:hypothetical protein
MFCRSLFVLLYFFFWPLCCLFLFDIRILIAPLVSSNSSWNKWQILTSLSRYMLVWQVQKTGGELRCSGRVGSSCSTSGTRRVNLVTNPVISREWGKDWEVFTTSGTYPWSFVTQIFHNGQPSHGESASYLDLHLEIDSEGRLRTTLYAKKDDFNFLIVNFPFICSNIPAYGVYISQMIRYSRACGSYQDFLDRGLAPVVLI